MPGDDDGLPLMSYFHCERSWWDERGRANVLLVHYADLKADLGGEMRRIADFLGIAVPAPLWPAGRGGRLRGHAPVGDTLLGRAGATFGGGGATFFHRGSGSAGGGWREVSDAGSHECSVIDYGIFSCACPRRRLPPEAEFDQAALEPTVPRSRRITSLIVRITRNPCRSTNSRMPGMVAYLAYSPSSLYAPFL